MPYTPTTWTEGVTKLGPTNMNHLETGVSNVTTTADAAIAKPSSPASNDGLVWNGSSWVNAKLVNANIDPAAAIVYSKLSLAGGIVNNDINASAAIAASKLALPAPPFIGQIDGGVAVTNPGANVAVIVPVSVPGAITITKLSWLINSTSGNYDIGVYDSSLNKLVSKGSTACGTANTVQTATVGSTVVPAGVAYIALVLDNGTANFYASTLGASLIIGPPIGQLQKATSFPLPSSLSGAASSTVPPACVTAL